MKFTIYQDVEAFKEVAIPFLEKHEAENGLPLGILESLTVQDEPLLMATVTENDALTMVMLQTIPEQIILSILQGLTVEDIPEFVRQIEEKGVTVPGLIGEPTFTMKLANELAELFGKRPVVKMNQRIYKLTAVKDKGSARGSMRLLTEQDLDVVGEWSYQFHLDVGFQTDRETAIQKAATFIENKRLYGWELDGALVSMAAVSRPTKHNITVSYVYTPGEYRRMGYAKACVAELSQLMLDQGYRTTSLYTDLDNPTSNKIYMEIGYEPVMDSVQVFLE